MATRTETQHGAAKAVGTTYVIVGSAVAASTTLNLLLHVANLLTSSVKLRAFIAAGSWSSGEPTGSDLVATLAYDTPVAGNDVFQITGPILTTGQKLVVRADTAAALDVSAHGVNIT